MVNSIVAGEIIYVGFLVCLLGLIKAKRRDNVESRGTLRYTLKSIACDVGRGSERERARERGKVREGERMTTGCGGEWCASQL